MHHWFQRFWFYNQPHYSEEVEQSGKRNNDRFHCYCLVHIIQKQQKKKHLCSGSSLIASPISAYPHHMHGTSVLRFPGYCIWYVYAFRQPFLENIQIFMKLKFIKHFSPLTRPILYCSSFTRLSTVSHCTINCKQPSEHTFQNFHICTYRGSSAHAVQLC